MNQVIPQNKHELQEIFKEEIEKKRSKLRSQSY